jgi:hypothetical protein
VRVLLEEQLPRQLTSHVVGHDVRTVQQQRWVGLKNGDLLTHAAAAGFEAFVTADQSLQFQQNLRGSPLFVVVLVARSNALEDLLPVVPEMLAALAKPESGRIVRIGAGK